MWPISKVLDCCLGRDIGTVYSQEELKRLMCAPRQPAASLQSTVLWQALPDVALELKLGFGSGKFSASRRLAHSCQQMSGAKRLAAPYDWGVVQRHPRDGPGRSGRIGPDRRGPEADHRCP